MENSGKDENEDAHKKKRNRNYNSCTAALPRENCRAAEVPYTHYFRRVVYSSIFLCFCFCAVFPLYSQSSTPSDESILLAAEIQKIEGLLSLPAIKGAEKRQACIRLARCYALSGNIEMAAQAWIDAAFAEQGSRDDDSLLKGVIFYIALGEYEKAEAGIKTVLSSSSKPVHLLEARYLNAQNEAFFRGNLQTLVSCIDDTLYADYLPRIYYTLWKLSGEETYKAKLCAEFPQSPEALIARTNDAQGRIRISAAAAPLWLLFPGRGGIEEYPVNQTSAQTGVKQILQTGIFGKEENALFLAEKLKRAGFKPVIINPVPPNDKWIAGVDPAGANITTLMKLLKEKGFESFPINR
ncbi:MAG: hypothetical protein LBQ88_14835 [Treponema sp.]|jgi:hypothetical protein|nr:hypothetical protein [Treponema sp.]